MERVQRDEGRTRSWAAHAPRAESPEVRVVEVGEGVVSAAEGLQRRARGRGLGRAGATLGRGIWRRGKVCEPVIRLTRRVGGARSVSVVLSVADGPKA